MATILLKNGENFKADQAQAVQYVTDNDMAGVFGFSGGEDWVQKLAYYAGEKKFGKSNAEIKNLVTDKKSLTDYYYEKGKITQDQYNKLKAK